MSPKKAILAITLFLGLYALLAGQNISRLSATVDEPLHTVAAYQIHYRGDYRIDREDPPLWLHFVGLFLDKQDIITPFTQEDWLKTDQGVGDPLPYLQRAVYQQPGAGGPEAIVKKARQAMLLLSLALGASLAFITWKLARNPWGGVAAVAATAAFSLEPLIIGHGIIVKNDIALALCFLWTTYFLHRTTTHATLANVLALSLSLAAALTTKFSGPILLIITLITLTARIGWGGAWPVLHLTLTTRTRRALAALAITLTLAAVSFTTIWAVYGFRFEPTPVSVVEGGFNMTALVNRTAGTQLAANAALLRPDQDPVPTPAEQAAWRPDLLTRTILFAHTHKLLPETYLAGFLFTYSSSLFRATYLLGHYSDTGFRTYFPLAFLFKTPLTLLALYTAGCILALRNNRWKRHTHLLLPIAIYALFSITTRLNIGLRHLLPIYPLLFIGLGLLIAFALHRLPKWTLAIPLLLLAAESLPTTRHAIAYFNLPSAQLSSNGLSLLSDSNLDWSQDLNLLVAWQKANPHEPLSLTYFGAADPRALGLTYTNTPESWSPGPVSPLQPGGVHAISATHLQGTYFTTQGREKMAFWRNQKPIAVLGNTIYLFRIP